jgi:uncharacterized protein DUF6503
MIPILPIFTFFLLTTIAFSQEITGNELLEKAINYHDPNCHWKNFNTTLHINLELPDKSIRYSKITIDQTRYFFKIEERKNDQVIERKIIDGECIISLNGKNEFSDDENKEHRLTCERTKFIRDYYTYLYGLPMKLKDEGTIIDPIVKHKKFMGKDYLVLKVTYDKKVGEDTWYFYFDPETYAMENYQFFHEETKNDGEYILLSEMLEINGIKIPMVRKWYVNKTQKFLGSDILIKAESTNIE